MRSTHFFAIFLSLPMSGLALAGQCDPQNEIYKTEFKILSIETPVKIYCGNILDLSAVNKRAKYVDHDACVFTIEPKNTHPYNSFVKTKTPTVYAEKKFCHFKIGDTIDGVLQKPCCIAGLAKTVRCGSDEKGSITNLDELNEVNLKCNTEAIWFLKKAKPVDLQKKSKARSNEV